MPAVQYIIYRQAKARRSHLSRPLAALLHYDAVQSFSLITDIRSLSLSLSLFFSLSPWRLSAVFPNSHSSCLFTIAALSDVRRVGLNKSTEIGCRAGRGGRGRGCLDSPTGPCPSATSSSNFGCLVAASEDWYSLRARFRFHVCLLEHAGQLISPPRGLLFDVTCALLEAPGHVTPLPGVCPSRLL